MMDRIENPISDRGDSKIPAVLFFARSGASMPIAWCAPLAFDHGILPRSAPRNRFVMPDDLSYNKDEEPLGKVWVELADSCDLTQTAYLLSFSCRIAGRQSLFGFQFADGARAAESFRQHVDNCGIYVIDAAAQLLKD